MRIVWRVTQPKSYRMETNLGALASITLAHLDFVQSCLFALQRPKYRAFPGAFYFFYSIWGFTQSRNQTLLN